MRTCYGGCITSVQETAGVFFEGKEKPSGLYYERRRKNSIVSSKGRNSVRGYTCTLGKKGSGSTREIEFWCPLSCSVSNLVSLGQRNTQSVSYERKESRIVDRAVVDNAGIVEKRFAQKQRRKD